MKPVMVIQSKRSQHCATRALRCQFRLLRCVVWLSCLLPLAGMAQTTAPALLPPEAQEAVHKGVIAAKQQDYLLAARFFQDARKLAPDAPEIYYDLGLAESKIPGRELRAIAWFGAYLAASPDTPNAAEVKEQIDVLDVKSQSNIARLLNTLQDMAHANKHRLPWVAGWWAESGDMTAALKIVNSLEDQYPKNSGYLYIVLGQARAGDVAGAQESADLIGNQIFKTGARGAIAVEQIREGDVAGAEKTFASALITANNIRDEVVNDFQYHYRDEALMYLAQVQAKVGDIKGAQKTVELVRNEYYMGEARLAIVTAQRTAGDLAGAQKTIGLMPEGSQKQQAQTFNWERYPTVTQSSKPAVSDWLKKLDDDDHRNDVFESAIGESLFRDRVGGVPADYCPLNSEAFLDVAGYLTAQRSDDPIELFRVLNTTAEKIIQARNVINKMLRQQAKK